MLLTTIALAALAGPIAAVPSPTPPVASTPSTPARGDHGKLPWFEGTYEELLAEARKSNRIVFLDFWTSW